jgi:hypothetical protein
MRSQHGSALARANRLPRVASRRLPLRSGLVRSRCHVATAKATRRPCAGNGAVAHRRAPPGQRHAGGSRCRDGDGTSAFASTAFEPSANACQCTLSRTEVVPLLSGGGGHRRRRSPFREAGGPPCCLGGEVCPPRHESQLLLGRPLKEEVTRIARCGPRDPRRDRRRAPHREAVRAPLRTV